MITLSYGFGGTPVIVGLMLLANMFLLLWDYNKLSVLVLPDNFNEVKTKNHYNAYTNHMFWAYLGLVMFATTVVYVLIYGRNPIGWFCVCVIEGLAGFMYMLNKTKVNSGTIRS
jgi:hypothetical protein